MMTLPTFWHSRSPLRGRPVLSLMRVPTVLLSLLLLSPVHAHEVHHGDATAVGTRYAGDVQSLLELFRKTGNDDYLDRAWEKIEPALTTMPHQIDLLIDAALVAQARHEFELALELTREAIELRQDNDQAWLLLASIHLVRGNVSEAGDACSQLRHTPLLVIMTCRARVAQAKNDFVHAKAQLDRLLTVVELTQPRDELLAWSLSVAGDLAVAAEQPYQATDYYSRSLELLESTQVRAALVDVLIAEQKLGQAMNVLDTGVSALPLVIRRFIVATSWDRAGELAPDIHKADREFQSWIADSDWLHAREMARFYLDVVDRPVLARRLALINLTLQQEPEDWRLELRTRT